MKVLLTARQLRSFCTVEEIREKLREHIKQKYVTQLQAAKAWGCSASFVNVVFLGMRDPPPIMLKEMGYEKVKGYAEQLGVLRAEDGDDEELSSEILKSTLKVLWRANDDDDQIRMTLEIRENLRLLIIEKYGDRKTAAAAWGCSVGLISLVIRGNKYPSDSMLNDLKIKKVTGYRRI